MRKPECQGVISKAHMHSPQVAMGPALPCSVTQLFGYYKVLLHVAQRLAGAS